MDATDAARYAEQAAVAIGLPITPARMPAVAQQLAGLLGAAALVMEHPLPEDVEPAPIFEP
jgi:hypothetical protein